MSGINEYSTTPGSNTTVNSIDIAEGCPPSTINNAIRQIMADIRGVVAVQSEASTHTIVAADLGNLMRFTGAATANLTAAATIGDNFWCVIRADGGAVTIDPNASETIDGASTLALADGEWAIIWCNGTTWYSIGSSSLTIGTDVQAWDQALDDISGLAVTDGNIIVGDGTNWVAESGATARTSLGVAIGTDVQAWDDDLDDLAALTPTDSNVIVGDGTNWVAESGATLRTSLGLGTGDSPTFTNLTNTGQVVWSKGADVASSGALTLGTDGNFFDITGTTTITSIGTLGIGTMVGLQFDGALTLTHHATDLILPSGANITTAAGDIATLYEYATGDWRCLSYTKADGTAVVAAGGPSLGTNAIIRTNATNVIEDITVYDHATAFDTSSTDTLNVGSDDGFANEDTVSVTTTGTLPTGLAIETTYYVINVAAGTMQLSTTNGGSAASITHTSGSGTHTIYQSINGHSAGPITVESGHSVTVPYGSTWGVT